MLASAVDVSIARSTPIPPRGSFLGGGAQLGEHSPRPCTGRFEAQLASIADDGKANEQMLVREHHLGHVRPLDDADGVSRQVLFEPDPKRFERAFDPPQIQVIEREATISWLVDVREGKAGAGDSS